MNRSHAALCQHCQHSLTLSCRTEVQENTVEVHYKMQHTCSTMSTAAQHTILPWVKFKFACRKIKHGYAWGNVTVVPLLSYLSISCIQSFGSAPALNWFFLGPGPCFHFLETFLENRASIVFPVISLTDKQTKLKIIKYDLSGGGNSLLPPIEHLVWVLLASSAIWIETTRSSTLHCQNVQMWTGLKNWHFATASSGPRTAVENEPVCLLQHTGLPVLSSEYQHNTQLSYVSK